MLGQVKELQQVKDTMSCEGCYDGCYGRYMMLGQVKDARTGEGCYDGCYDR